MSHSITSQAKKRKILYNEVLLYHKIQNVRIAAQRRAELQLDIASKWGRYAELFGYDDAQGRFFLEDVAVTV